MLTIGKNILACVLVLGLPSLAVHYEIGEMLRSAEKPSDYIGLIFSILAASLFAVISIVGDPSMLVPGGWRNAWREASGIQLRLMRLIYLFLLYLVVLALLVAAEIIESEGLTGLYFVHDIFAFLAIFAFLVSLWLPFEIKEIQISRLEKEIAARRERPNS